MSLTKSIQSRLLLWIFFSVSTLFIISGFSLYSKLRTIILESVDQGLHSKLQLIKGLVHSHDSVTVEYEVEEFVLGEYVIPRSGKYYQVFVAGELHTASFSLVDKEFKLITGPSDSYDVNSQEGTYLSVGPVGEPLRVIRHDFVFMDKSICLIVAEDLTENFAVIDRLVGYCFIVLPVMTVLIGLVSLIIASISLRPLQVFSAAIEKITHRTLNKRIDEGNHAREVQGLAERFNALLARLEQAFEAEKHLIADAAHELKTPLAVITAECDISMQKTRSAEEYIDSLKEIRFVSETMLRQINSMLTLARLDSGMLSVSTFQPVSLNRCIETASHLVESLAAKKNILLSKALHDNLTVHGNKDTLTEAILNIIENAVKYNSPGGSVSIALKARNRQAEISIRDTGIGISPEELERIFDRFYRSETARSMEGTGLGLSIARAVIQAHSGDIAVHSESSGSRFLLTLPL